MNPCLRRASPARKSTAADNMPAELTEAQRAAIQRMFRDADIVSALEAISEHEEMRHARDAVDESQADSPNIYHVVQSGAKSSVWKGLLAKLLEQTKR